MTGERRPSSVEGETRATVRPPYAIFTSVSQSELDTIEIDDFDDGDMSEYSGLKSSDNILSTVKSPTKRGSHSVEIANTNANISTSGLKSYPTAGNKFRFHLYIPSGSTKNRPQVSWCASSNDNRYAVDPKPYDNTLELFKYTNGTYTSLASDTSWSEVRDEWMEFIVDHKADGQITVTVYDESGNQLSQISATDTDHKTTEGIVLGDAYDGLAYIDEIELIN